MVSSNSMHLCIKAGLLYLTTMITGVVKGRGITGVQLHALFRPSCYVMSPIYSPRSHPSQPCRARCPLLPITASTTWYLTVMRCVLMLMMLSAAHGQSQQASGNNATLTRALSAESLLSQTTISSPKFCRGKSSTPPASPV